jgi:proline iminopeptidase
MIPLEPLADQFTLIFYDHRCNGRSEGADVSSMTWDNLTADAEALRQKLGFKQWAVLGHSFGGMVAQEYALRYPDSLSHLLLMDTCGDTWWVQDNAPRLLAKRGYNPAAVEAARRFFNGQLTPDEVFRAAMKFARAYYYRSSRSRLIREIPAGFKVKMQPEAQIFGFGHLLKGWSVMDRLGEIQTPALVLAGRDDFQFPPEHQAILADRLPNSQLTLVERAGHNAPMERPDEVIEIIQRFMTGADAAGR